MHKFYDILPVERKFTNETVWNITGLFISGISGLGLQILVARFYDPSALGILNLTLVIMTIYSQISGFGIHFSVLKHIPEYAGNSNEVRGIMLSSFILTFFVSLLFVLIFFILIYLAKGIFSSNELFDSLVKISPVFVLFPLNKVMLAYLNGLRRMKIYAVYYSMRYVNWLVCALVIYVFMLNSSNLPYIFTLSECILFILLLPYSYRNFGIFRFFKLKKWNEINFRYGYKSVLGTVFADIGTRADILILGAFTSHYYVGIYSMASVIIDGFNQFSITFRTLVNPVLTKSFFNDDELTFKSKIRKGKKLYYLLVSPIALAVIILFPVVILILNLNPEYNLAYIPLIIMLVGFILSSGYHPFQMLFNQTGHPGKQTNYFGMILVTNIMLNVTLIPFLGIYGAAIAASLTFVIMPFYLNYLSINSFGFRF